MLRPALIAMSLLLVSLVALTLIPRAEPSVPEATITLLAPELTLYPEADREAVWHFAAEHASYDTAIRETVLTTIYDGQRVLEGDIDFTLTSDRITIDRSDNLRSPRMDVHLLDSNWFLDMQSKDDREVFINQRQGKFEVPVLTYTGDGIGESRDENVRMNFDLTDFEAGGPDSIGYNRFLDDGL
ncbi:MAG: hypothetical protein AAF708_21165 [Deinococcota bacterium]